MTRDNERGQLEGIVRGDSGTGQGEGTGDGVVSVGCQVVVK